MVALMRDRIHAIGKWALAMRLDVAMFVWSLALIVYLLK